MRVRQLLLCALVLAGLLALRWLWIESSRDGPSRSRATARFGPASAFYPQVREKGGPRPEAAPDIPPLSAPAALAGPTAPNTAAPRPAPPLSPAPAAPPPELRDYPTPEKSIVINEIQYHPPGGDRREEWIELLNRSKKKVDLGGWKLDQGVTFTFPAGTTLEPGAFLVVCASKARWAGAPGFEHAVGDWTGNLSRDGESIRIVNARDEQVDLVKYKDKAPFPVLADGLGRSLERRSPHERSDWPANWGASTTVRGDAWIRFQGVGVAVSTRLYFYMVGTGRAFIDDVVVREAGGGRTILEEGFEADVQAWSGIGTHSGSKVSRERAHAGKGSFEVVASSAGSGKRSAAACDIADLELGHLYEVGFWAYFPEPQTPLVARFSAGGTGNRGLMIQASPGGNQASATPGAPSSIQTSALPPFVHPVRWYPERPKLGEPVKVEATVLARTGLKEVVLHYDDCCGEESMPLKDEGGGTFSATLGPYSKATLVRLRVTAQDEAGRSASFPFDESPTNVLGLYAADPPPQSTIPTYEILLAPDAVQDLDSNPFGDAYKPGVFVHDGRAYLGAGFRYRGQTSRFLPKHHWKVHFAKDQPFVTPTGDEVASINLQSSYGDKTFLREILSYDFWRDMGEASSECYPVRVRWNGQDLGLYLHLENPNGGYLSRNGRDALSGNGGWLWKAYSTGQWGASGFELKAGAAETGTPLLDGFFRSINSLSGSELDAYLREHVQVESLLNYLAACQVVHNADQIEKNYLVYADPGGRMTFLPWDMDLTHGRNFECSGGGVWNDEIRWDMWDPENGDEKLLFGTRAHMKCDVKWNTLYEAFLRRTKTFLPEYYRRIALLLGRFYDPDIVVPKVERLAAVVRPYVAKDRKRWGTYGGEASFDRQVKELETWARKRYEHLTRKLTALGYKVPKPLNADFECAEVTGTAPFKASFTSRSFGEIASTEWKFSDGGTAAGTECTHVFEKPGKYDVTLRVTGPDGSHEVTRRKRIVVRK